jgi:hypothetical protein
MLVSLMPRKFPRDLMKQNLNVKSIPVPARSKAWFCGRWLVGVAGSNPSVADGIFCQLMFTVTGRLLVQRIPTECGVCECDHETSTMRKLWPTRDCRAMKNNYIKITAQTRSSGEISDFYSGGENFESWPRHFLSWGVSWFFCVQKVLG